MKIGDLVMFKPSGRYAEWFGGHIATVKSVSRSRSGELHCRVVWMKPVKYYNSYTPMSDFAASRFDIIS